VDLRASHGPTEVAKPSGHEEIRQRREFVLREGSDSAIALEIAGEPDVESPGDLE